jgi:probable HAF family extracellular repeat protein
MTRAARRRLPLALISLLAASAALVLAASGLGAEAAHGAGTCTVVDLGSQLLPSDINDHGQIVGGDGLHAYVWDRGTLTEIPTSGDFAYAAAIDNRGQVVGASFNSGSADGFLWDNGGVTDLGPFLPTDINDRGDIVASTAENRGVLLQDGSVIDLGTLGGAYTTPLEINKRGEVVGFSSTTTNSGQPFHWENGSMTALGFLPGGTYGAVDDLNDRGQLVGYSQGPPPTFGNHLVLWENGRIRDLGLPEGFYYVEPTAINNRGDIVGVAFETVGDAIFEHGWFYRDGTFTMLESCLPTGTNISLRPPREINDHGDIVASGLVGDSEYHGFLIRF